ncbi:MAG: DUF1549 domain-containing protein [Verrucomicrobiales bacterium]|nr:DUF1549 domain-containing protein [Verrucomicrobiales bacterium]
MKILHLLSLCVLAAISVQVRAETSKISPTAEIDRLIKAGLAENEIKPNPVASDEVLVRRIYLDIIGRIPTQEESGLFIDSEDPEKVANLVDELIGSEGYVSHFYNYFADLLRIKSRLAAGGQSIAPGMGYEMWVKDALRENRPYDKMVYDLVTASGSSWENPAIGYYLRDYGMPLDNLAITTQIFLASQIVCAQCHDHPFDETTQMDYYHLAAFTYPVVTSNRHPDFARVSKAIEEVSEMAPAKFTERSDLRKGDSEILFPVRFNNVSIEGRRKLRLPHDYQYDDAEPRSVVEPRTLLGPDAVISEDTTLPEAFGSWLTSKDNPRFGKVIANRLWKKAFGLALIEPVDDLKEGITGPNPELMDYMEQLMLDLDFDLQAYLSIVFKTDAYRREATLEEHTPGAPYYFQGPVLRRMSAEQIWDSLVTLAISDPDTPSARRELEYEKRIATVQLIGEAVYGKSPKKYARDVVEVVKVQKGLTAEIDAATAEMAVAQESGDEEAIKAARRAANQVRAKLADRVEEVVYRSGIEKQVELVASNANKEDPFFSDLASFILADGERTFDEGMDDLLGGEAGGIVKPVIEAMFYEKQQAVLKQEQEKKADEMASWKVPEKGERRRDYSKWRTLAKTLVRASDISSPAPPGHFLGEFGQSDRELVENSSDDASITQALALLNGNAMSAIGNRFSVLTRSMRGERFRDRLDTIYMAMLTRKPTSQEVRIFREAWEAEPESGSVHGIVWTILNTRQFLFIQ